MNVIVLAAGDATRLYPLTGFLPGNRRPGIGGTATVVWRNVLARN